MQSGDFLKIGVTSKSIYQRVKEIQTGCPTVIEEVYYYGFTNRAEAFNTEKKLHSIFSEYNTSGEWFIRFKRFGSKINKIIGFEYKKIKLNDYKLTDADKERIELKNKKAKDLVFIDKYDKKVKKIKKAIARNPLLSGVRV